MCGKMVNHRFSLWCRGLLGADRAVFEKAPSVVVVDNAVHAEKYNAEKNGVTEEQRNDLAPFASRSSGFEVPDILLHVVMDKPSDHGKHQAELD